MDGNTLFAIKQIMEEFEGQLTGIPEDTEYDGRIAVKNKKEVERLHSELDEVYAKAKVFDRIVKNLEKYDEQAIDSLNVNYHDFGGDTACMIDDFKEGDTNER